MEPIVSDGMNTIWTSEKEEQFFNLLGKTANVSKTCEAINISRAIAYQRRDRDEEFAKRWEEAVALGTRFLEDEAARRASEGWDEPVFYQGAKCGVVRKYSDTLLIFLLKARDPKYREKSSLALTGPGGGPLASVGLQTTDPIEAARAYQEMIKGTEE